MLHDSSLCHWSAGAECAVFGYNVFGYNVYSLRLQISARSGRRAWPELCEDYGVFIYTVATRCTCNNSATDMQLV